MRDRVPDDIVALRTLAESGGAQAQYRLGQHLARGPQREEALSWLRRAAAQDHLAAATGAARLLLEHAGRAGEVREARELLERAELRGDARAGYLLASLELGAPEATRDFARINARVLAAARAGLPVAMRAVALTLGRAADRAPQRAAVQLLRLASERGDTISHALLRARQRIAAATATRCEDSTATDPRRSAAAREALEADARGEPGAMPPTFAAQQLLSPCATRALAARPRVAWLQQLLTPEECEFVIEMARPHLRPSQSLHPDSGVADAHAARTSHDANLTPRLEDFQLRLLQLRMTQAADCTLRQAETLVVLRYLPGQQYLPHRDYLPPQALQARCPQAGQRLRSLCTYLNSVEAGGATEFPVAGLTLAPQPGCAVVFDNLRRDGSPDPDSLHAGLAVERGEKWLATLWLRERDYRAW
jgi:prolyl 4-hydroxylase